MRVAEEPIGGIPNLYLRVYNGPEADQARSSTDLDFDRDPPPNRSDAEREAFWAGRNTAGRLSARMAA